MAARPDPEAPPGGGPHGLYAAPPPHGLYAAPGPPGEIEIKRAAKAGHAPAMYHMHTSYATKAAQISAERPLRAAERVLRDKYQLKSEYWLREAKQRDPGGAAYWTAIYAARDTGDYQLMRSHLNAYLEHLAPQCCKVYYELGRVCKVLGLGPESKKHFEAAAILTRRDAAADSTRRDAAADSTRRDATAWRASVP